MRLLICAGGTGGGVYPALAVLQALISSDEEPKVEAQSSVLWVGSAGGMETDLVKRLGIPFEPIPAAGLHGVGLRALPGNVVQIGRGFKASRKILKAFHPDVLFFTGGYMAVPMAIAGRFPTHDMPRPRTLLYIPDIEPGLALKTLTRLADHIAVTVEETRQFLPARSHVTVTGYPSRHAVDGWSMEQGRKVFGIGIDLPVLLVTGGSKGARSINNALLVALPELLPEMNVIHVTGELDWPDVQRFRQTLSEKTGLTEDQVSRYKAMPYLHEEMGAALTIADLVISRAGASILGEYPQFGLPAILVPYPHAWQYQWINARYLSDKGAAVIINDSNLSTQLVSVVREIMTDPQRREQMRQAMQALAIPGAAHRVATILRDLDRPGKHPRI